MSTKKKQDLASRLLAWRAKHELGREAAAAELKISKRTLQEWEQRRRRNPRLDTVEHVLIRLQRDGF